MLSKVYWLGDNGVLVRAIRTWAQTGFSLLGVQPFSVFQFDWKTFLGTPGGAAFVPLLMGLARAEAKSDPAAPDYIP